MKNSIDYASPKTRESQAKEPQVSALAVSSMLVSILACPCLSGWFFAKLCERYFIGAMPPVAGVFVLMVPALIMAVVALVRIKASGGQILGADFCYFAFTFCGIWLLAILIMMAVLKDFWSGLHLN